MRRQACRRGQPLPTDAIEGLAMELTTVIEQEGTGYVALCPELDIASQGDDMPEARNNLQEAIELFLECASPQEVRQRFFIQFNLIGQ